MITNAAYYIKLVVSFVLILLCVIFAQASSSDGEKFSYTNYIAPTLAKYSHCYGEGIQTVTNFAADKSLRRRRVRRMEFAFAEERARSIETLVENLDNSPMRDSKTKKDPPNRQTIRIYNPKYSALLAQPQSTSEFVIRSLDAGPEAGLLNYRVQYSDPAHCITAAQRHSISRLTQRPNFRVDRVAEVEPKLGRHRVRVDFSFPIPPERGNIDLYLSAGTLVFFPDEGWIIESYKLTESSFSTPKKFITRFGQVSYSQTDANVLQPIDTACASFRGNLEAEPKSSEPNYEPIELETFHFDKFVFGDLPEREFTLSAFGLPEYTATANRRLDRPFPWWILATSIGIGGVAWVLWRIGKRPRQRAVGA